MNIAVKLGFILQEIFETFFAFKKFQGTGWKRNRETYKIFRSDHGGEYSSQEL